MKSSLALSNTNNLLALIIINENFTQSPNLANINFVPRAGNKNRLKKEEKKMNKQLNISDQNNYLKN